MSTSELQVQIFQHVKAKLPPHLSLVDELAAVLDVSTDSAYRRIRGEKPLSLEEIYKLCVRYGLSLDNLFNLHSDGFSFKGNFVNPHAFKYDDYLSNIVQQLKYMNGFKQKSMTYLAKDIPIFHHYHFKEIAAFKYYFWMTNILQHPDFTNKKFRLGDYPDEYFELSRKALEYYNQLDSVEFWNIESINSTLRQIDYYYDSNIFSNSDEIFVLYDAAEKLISHLEHQATVGYKFAVDDLKTPLGSYQLYFNEILILEGNILVTLDGTKSAFLIHNVLNFLQTNDVRFCDNMYVHIQNLKKKSTLISTVSERERSRFFKYLRQRIETRKQNRKA
jgi:BetR domain